LCGEVAHDVLLFGRGSVVVSERVFASLPVQTPNQGQTRHLLQKSDQEEFLIDAVMPALAVTLLILTHTNPHSV
jgi:hypothetical protein